MVRQLLEPFLQADNHACPLRAQCGPGTDPAPQGAKLCKSLLIERGNKRTTNEGPSDLKFQSTTLPKTGSWPRVCSAAGQFQTINESLLNYERSFAQVGDEAKDPRDDDYEAPGFPMAGPWQLMKILPARPLKESEYADTRCLKDAVASPLSLDGKMSLPAEARSWHTQMKLDDVDRHISKDIRSQHVSRDKSPKRNKTPLPPPRLPVAPLPKMYQPLPPEPDSSRSPLPKRHIYPEVQRGPRQISLKNLSEVLGTEKVPYHQRKPEACHLSWNQSAPETPHAVASSSLKMSRHRVQNRDHKGSVQPQPSRRCPAPASVGPREHAPPRSAASSRKPLPARPGEEAVQHHNEWYVGEYSRQEVEEALLKENKDGAFLVRDCSMKSQTEPYVLVVFYGNKVYNVKIRFLERDQQFVLGTGLRGGERFDSVEDIIEHYKCFPIVLVDGKDKTGTRREQCYLAQPLPLNKLSSPR
ncbi:cytokine-dependent hematopoietic cell linker [Pteronotus mesoamericanus]|uniref:cytokine-dependent hematopoietic cell linker n=1 Tax=Pteronotus mesoamericanus TaxID=1884717 RepID=UPI0023EC0F29|nr:cytokine-dependent hematopoietic cell linker [Pteronotus parnellii mesoamericanus]